MISVLVRSIYSVVRLKRYRKCSLVPVWGRDCMGIFKKVPVQTKGAVVLWYSTVQYTYIHTYIQYIHTVYSTVQYRFLSPYPTKLYLHEKPTWVLAPLLLTLQYKLHLIFFFCGRLWVRIMSEKIWVFQSHVKVSTDTNCIFAFLS